MTELKDISLEENLKDSLEIEEIEINQENQENEKIKEYKPFQELNEDIILYIFEYLEMEDNLNISLCNKKYYEYSIKNKNWSILLKDSIGSMKMKTIIDSSDVYRLKYQPIPIEDSIKDQKKGKNYKKQYIKFKKMYKKDKEKMETIININEKLEKRSKIYCGFRIINWVCYLILFSLLMFISIFLIPLHLDNFIPIDGYFWIIPYSLIGFFFSKNYLKKIKR
jgi:hypothetical protein